MDNPLDFSGRTVLVTGGGRGIGRGISERFLAAGADVVVCSRSRPDVPPRSGGLTRTEQAHLHYGDEAGIAAVAATVPLGRMALPGDVGDACLFLASPLASYVSGTSFAVHGAGEKPAFLDSANAG